MRHSFTAIVWLLLLPPLCAAQANLHSSWPNFPRSTSFFPTFGANGHNYQPKIYLITREVLHRRLVWPQLCSEGGNDNHGVKQCLMLGDRS